MSRLGLLTLIKRLARAEGLEEFRVHLARSDGAEVAILEAPGVRASFGSHCVTMETAPTNECDVEVIRNIADALGLEGPDDPALASGLEDPSPW